MGNGPTEATEPRRGGKSVHNQHANRSKEGRLIMRKIALPLAIIAVALPFLAASPAQAQATRTWVSGTGNDMNPCSRTAPCKTFAGALANNKTAAGGEVNCLDPGGFDTVSITFSVTISCEAGTAGVLATSGAVGIFIDAGASGVVTLRGLDIDGQGTGGVGIFLNSAKAVHIEKSTIRNFRSGFVPAGIVTGGSGTAFMYLADTVISDNSTGMALTTTSGGFKIVSLKNVTIAGSTFDGVNAVSTNVFVNVTDSIISGNGRDGVVTNAPATVNVDRSTLANNTGAALNAAAGGSTIRASGNNIYNNTNGISIGGGAFVQSDGVNKHGNSNGGVAPNTALAQY